MGSDYPVGLFFTQDNIHFTLFSFFAKSIVHVTAALHILSLFTNTLTRECEQNAILDFLNRPQLLYYCRYALLRNLCSTVPRRPSDGSSLRAELANRAADDSTGDVDVHRVV